MTDNIVPATYVELDEFPVNHNLTAGRNALPDSEFAIEVARSASAEY